MGGDGEERRDQLETISDQKLDESIARQRRNYGTMVSRLPDKGQKILSTLSRLEEERERRKCRRLLKDDGGDEMPIQSRNPSLIGAPASVPQSQFGMQFCCKMEENDTDCRTVKTFGKEFTALGRCDRLRKKSNGLTSRQTTPIFLSANSSKQKVSNGAQKGGHPSPGSPDTEEDLFGSFSKWNSSKVRPSNTLRPRKRQTVIIVDEEEPQFVETVQLEDEVDDCIKDIKIYYPSRDDPESVEICYADMECLAPETYLSSTIMNFYIRYLQQQTCAINRATCYHFFTTYFYKKLKEAVQNKTNEKEKSFVNFRKWWKGVNIFEKAYLVLPIHEDQHWSLVIICIPDKEDKSGPIALHLDSLRLHSSRSIFENVKSFLKTEWNYLNQEETSSNYPIAGRIGHNLSLRIDERRIMVPQQKNEYDCGLFVLFFMKRFIEDAPQRLIKNDLAMFGNRWFNPEEASDLRLKIRSLLRENFKKENRDRSVSEPY